ncbi:hypothetical protein ACJX0J_006684, partial [Zea mays]
WILSYHWGYAGYASRGKWTDFFGLSLYNYKALFWQSNDGLACMYHLWTARNTEPIYGQESDPWYIQIILRKAAIVIEAYIYLLQLEDIFFDYRFNIILHTVN